MVGRTRFRRFDSMDNVEPKAAVLIFEEEHRRITFRSAQAYKDWVTSREFGGQRIIWPNNSAGDPAPGILQIVETDDQVGYPCPPENQAGLFTK